MKLTCLRGAALAGAAFALAVLTFEAQAQRALERRPAASAAAAPTTPAAAAPAGVVATIAFADIGFGGGFRFANLGGRRDIFVPMPQGADIKANELVLAIDDVSAHDARRSLEILVNDRSASAIALDGRALGRVLRIPLARTKAQDGYLKLTFIYSGAATQDRCIDVRYIGDSLTVRPETSVELEIKSTSALDVPTSAALLPRDVAVVTSGRRLAASDIAAALTIGRSLKMSGRRVTFHHGFENLPDLVKREDPRRWSRGIVLLGTIDEALSYLDAPVAKIAGPTPAFGTLTAVRTGGLPALLVSEGGAVKAARLLASPTLAAMRGVPAATIGEFAAPKLPAGRATLDELKLAPAVAEVFGRAELSFAIASRTFAAGTRPSRIVLDIMVAPDAAGEKAVVSTFVNERLLGSTVAATNEPTRLDLALPEGLAGTDINVRTVVQRRSAQGDCRFEPQGYPAQILGSSAVILTNAGERPRDFSDFPAWWADSVDIVLPAISSDRPESFLGLISDVLGTLSSETAIVNVTLLERGTNSVPAAAFIAVSNVEPAGSEPRVRFDRGRVAVADRSGRSLLDLGGFTGGAVAQIVTIGAQPGLWIKPLSADGSLPSPAELKLDRGDVAFLDNTGVAFAMSTLRDTLVKVDYPDQISWASIAERFRAWIVGALWALATVAFLFVLQRMFRRRPNAASE